MKIVKYSASTFYNTISFLYPLINYFLKGQKELLIEEVNRCARGKLLEIGVGEGSHLPLYFSHHITGIDISKGMLEKAKRFQNDNITLLLMDAENLSFSEASFDYVVISHVLAVANDPDKLLQQVYQVLKPGGKLFILNHFTPSNSLRYVDRLFHPFSFLFHLKSMFYTDSINGLKQFQLVKQTDLGKFAYYKLLILSKP